MTDVSFDSDDFLAHHGVLGMHWGERNAETVAKEGPGKTTSKERTAAIKEARARVADKENAAENRYTKKVTDAQGHIASTKAVHQAKIDSATVEYDNSKNTQADTDKYLKQYNTSKAAIRTAKINGSNSIRAAGDEFDRSLDSIGSSADAQTAAKYTRGEKAATAAVLGAFGIGALAYGALLAKL